MHLNIKVIFLVMFPIYHLSLMGILSLLIKDPENRFQTSRKSFLRSFISPADFIDILDSMFEPSSCLAIKINKSF